MSSINKWKEENIGEGLKLLSGYPFSSSKFSNEDGFPLIRIRDIVNSSIETYYLGRYLPMYVIKQDDMLVGMDGDFNLVRWKNQDALLNQRVLKVDILDSEKLDREFVYYWLQPYVRKLNELTAATTVKHLSTKDIRKAKSKIPALLVQRKIGKILKTIDETIEKTKALIKKYQQIKAGLMHDLFTRGIGADGQLRPPREQAPELYQQTPIGWIPKDWELMSLDTVAEVIDPQPDHRTPPEVLEGVPYVGIGDFDKFGELNLQKCRKVIHEAYEKQRRRFITVSGDIIFGKIGTIGKPKTLQSGDYALSANVVLIKPNVAPNYVRHTLDSIIFLKQISDITNTTSQPALGIEKIRVILVPVPSNKEEMAFIYQKLDALDAKLHGEGRNLEKLVKQKSGLMHDLLTGKVEVEVKNPEPLTTPDIDSITEAMTG